MTTDQLKTLFENDLRHKLEPLEALRLEALRRRKFLGVAVCVFFGAVAFDIATFATMFVLLALLLGGWAYFNKKHNEYRTTYKQYIMQSLLAHIEPSLTWDPSRKLDKDTFERSGLYLDRCDGFESDDFISGTIGEAKVVMSEIQASKLISSGSDSSSKHHVFFAGLFCEIDVPMNENICTFVLTDRDDTPTLREKLWDSFFKIQIGKRVRLGNPEFDQQYEVYSDDLDTAKQLLTDELIERVLTFRRESEFSSLSLSQVNGKLYIAISHWKELFEPKLDEPAGEFEAVAEIYRELDFLIGTVRSLDLMRPMMEPDSVVETA
ncbi:DUF3137 domain-containing protein [Vibrio harveyi]|uniref:DUF3137 domain-containing protein n=1 Tax=Vibrio harveyi TaxID=669 RepID=UPI00093875C9|nr:DUF3137 domain-containing protein [Vibrio harveyi]APP08849.1 hypothetical protein BG259_26875 [Vibrio harveyi]